MVAGNPVHDVKVPADGVPMFGVTNVGLDNGAFKSNCVVTIAGTLGSTTVPVNVGLAKGALNVIAVALSVIAVACPDVIPVFAVFAATAFDAVTE